jgi:hypothetical protein
MAILKGILSTNLGIRAYNSVNVTSKFLLKPFAQKLTNDRSSTVVLTYYEVIFFAWGELSIKRWLMWCWRSLLWGRINQAILTSKNGLFRRNSDHLVLTPMLSTSEYLQLYTRKV